MLQNTEVEGDINSGEEGVLRELPRGITLELSFKGWKEFAEKAMKNFLYMGQGEERWKSVICLENVEEFT